MSFLNSVLKIFVGDKSKQDVKALSPYVDKIKSFESALEALSHDGLRAKTAEFKAKIANRTQLGRGCPFCAGRYATKNKNLKILYPNLIKEWNYQFNKEKKPENFTPISGQYVWWDCEHGHIYRKAISHRTSPVKKGVRGGGGRNTKCPCQTKHQNGKLYSPAIFPLIRKEFSVKNKIKLTSLTILDKRQFFWVCKNNHKYKNSIFRRIFYNERCIDCFDYEIELRQPLHDPNESKMLK